MNFLQSFLKRLTDIFRSDRAKRAFAEVERIVPVALPIVERIAALTPNRTDDEIVAAFRYYGVPFIEGLASVNPTGALLELASSAVAQRLPAGTAKNIVQTAVQIAVTASKA